MRLILFSFLLSFIFSIAYGQGTEKIKGISFDGPRTGIRENDVQPIVSIHANWVTLMPFGFLTEDGLVVNDTDYQWWGGTEEGVEKMVNMCQKEGLKMMIKPQVWVKNDYTGHLNFKTNAEWCKFEDSYAQFIMTFVSIAVKYDIEMFCIGTEWKNFVKKRPQFWQDLIAKIRLKFKGDLTYAANWDDYKEVSFWEELDYIGVDAYFPISKSKNPQLPELIEGWKIHNQALARFSKSKNKQIILTEIGYKSVIGATKTPWEHFGDATAYSEELQDLAFKAMFSVIWDQPWCKGVFLWKWYTNHGQQGGFGNIDFTPQNKKAEETIREFWKNNP